MDLLEGAGGADPENAVLLLDAPQLRHPRHVDDRIQVPMLLGHPKPDIGRSGEQQRLRVFSHAVARPAREVGAR
ncbi:MAG: hypothetical protein HC868_07825 [Sphingomonadales bacterium]|nr:hypothetical protein [Sphingomonadales bacterium]